MVSSIFVLGLKISFLGGHYALVSLSLLGYPIVRFVPECLNALLKIVGTIWEVGASSSDKRDRIMLAKIT